MHQIWEILSTSDSVQGCGDVEETQTIQGSVNGQFEMGIPSGESGGAIHTIQLQSPGGNTHDGLVVSNATATSGSDGVDGTTETALFQTAFGTFLLPTSHANSSTNSLINSSVSPEGGEQCEVITADPTDYILSGLQVVRVTTGENCETIFLVPSDGGAKVMEPLASLTSPKQSNSTPKTRKNKAKTVQQTTPQAQTPMNMAKKTTAVQIIPTTSSSNPPSPFIPITHTTTQPSPPVVTVPQPLAGGTPIQATPPNYFLPEDIVSDSEEEGEVTPIRKCIVCLRRRRFTEPIFDANRQKELGGSISTSRKQLLQSVETLIAPLDISASLATVKPNDVGICTACLDPLQKWHIFTSAIAERRETVKSSGAPFDDSSVNWEPFEARIYRNLRKMRKVKEVYYSGMYRHLTRRQLTEKDWDFFCEHVNSKRFMELDRYMMCREKLTHLYCIKCQRLVKNGKKGFVKHMKIQHPHDTVLLPCDICGNHYPDKDASTSQNYFPHWISHFYFNSCEDCGKRFPTKRALGQHKQTVHKNKTAQWNRKPGTVVGEDRPWKCDQCEASFKKKGALVAHRDVIHFNLNHLCFICGKAFKSASSLRGHVRRHEGRRDYKCEVCHKEYFTQSALKGHQIVHQTARDFICGVCGKAFKKKKALLEHETLHTGVKPHTCPICGREIRVKSNLYKHLKIHQKNAELGITSGRGRHMMKNASTVAAGSSSTQPTLPHVFRGWRK